MVSKQRLKNRIIAFGLVLLMVLPTILNITQIDTYASYSEWASSLVNSKGEGSGAGTDHITNGVAAVRTGYLCYMVNKETGAKTSDCKAFKSPGYSEIPGTVNIITGRRGGGASNWTGTAPWGLKPWEPVDGGVSTNEPEIKNWFIDYGTDFVQHQFPANSANFQADEEVLVLETLMNFQYSKASDGKKKIYTRSDAESIIKQQYKSQVALMSAAMRYDMGYTSTIAKWFKATPYERDNEQTYREIYSHVYDHLIGAILFELEESETGGEREMLGTPLLGTVPNLVDAKLSPVFDSYINQAACFAESVKTDEAGFVAISAGARRLSDAEVHNYGVAMMIIHCHDDAIHTYWQPNGSPGDPEPPKPGEFNIVKHYYTKKVGPGGGITYTEDGTYVRHQCVPNISVDDEPDEYKLESWATQSDYDPGISNHTDSRFKSGIQSGTSPKMITLKKDDAEKTVYVLLVRGDEEEEEPVDFDYELKQSQITRKIAFSRPDNVIHTEKEMIDFKHIFNHPAFVHCTGHSWSCPHTKSCSGCVDTDGDGVNDSCPGDHDDTQSGEITCYEPENWKWNDRDVMLSIRNSLRDSYPDILATKEEGFKALEIKKDSSLDAPEKHWVDDGTIKRKVNSNNGDNGEGGNDLTQINNDDYYWDYVCVLMRGKDKLVVAEYENERLETPDANTDLDAASASGFEIGNEPSGQRKIIDYYDKFNANFLKDSDGDYDTEREPNGPPISVTCPRCGVEQGPFKCAAETQTTTLTAGFKVNDITVKVNVYSGSTDGGFADTTINEGTTSISPLFKPTSGSGTLTYSGRQVKSGGTISFTPYIKMRYHTMSSPIESKGNPAQVVSEYHRSMVPNDYAEIVWYKPSSSDTNLTLTSTEWSTHATAVQNFGTNNVLPGGATMNLDIRKDDRQRVRVTTYQTIVVGSGLEQIEKMGGDIGGLDEAQAIEAHTAYVNSVMQAIEQLNVQQWVNKDTGATTAWSGSGKPVDYRGSKNDNISFLGNMSTGDSYTSGDSKYYFRKDGTSEAAQEGDLDVHDLGNETKYYTFFTNTYGGGVLWKNTTGAPGKIDTEFDGAALGGEGAIVNAHTNVADKLELAVEQQNGHSNNGKCFDDEALTGELWYNEAFDGVTVIVQSDELEVGYIDPPQRQSVLDPKLIPLLKDGTDSNTKATMFQKYFLSQFKMRNYSDYYGESASEIVGEFKDKRIQMKDMEYLYKSKKFWIPNATVQDLY